MRKIQMNGFSCGIYMLNKLKMYIKTLFAKLSENLTSGYLAYCEDCGHIERLFYLKDAQRFMCRNCIVRYAKLYIKVNNLDRQCAYIKSENIR